MVSGFFHLVRGNNLPLSFFSNIEGLKTGDKITCKISGNYVIFYNKDTQIITTFRNGHGKGAVEGNYFVMMDSVEGRSKAIFYTLDEFIRNCSMKQIVLVADEIAKTTPKCLNTDQCMCTDCVYDIKDAEETQEHLRCTMYE